MIKINTHELFTRLLEMFFNGKFLCVFLISSSASTIDINNIILIVL